ncbi:dienelactone hydrolase family protein [Bacteroidia bacterium]|nr:dienelactone hydrolase family protein [Bacteroidia bacterium]MDB9881551.1 dienelactone hydrolase family protein [Bacteroidia bacterium]
MIRTILLALIFAISFTSCKDDEPVIIVDPAVNTGLSTQTLYHDSKTREYVIFVPESYDGASAVPLILNFHGFSGQASDYMKYADMRALAESETFILVYPQGSDMDGSSHWNPSLPGGDNKSDADDLGFTEALINEISSNYSIDAKRVYACGYSNGGMMAYGLANYKSNLIAAVGCVSGVMLDLNGTTSHPMPVIHLHGTSDGVIPYTGGQYYNAAESVIDHWIDFNNTTETPTENSETSGGITIEHSLYDQGDNGVSVELYKYVNGDHVWFTNTYQENSTSQLIWNFVSKYDIDGLR